MLETLNAVCVILHIAVTLFNLLGWLWRRTRRVHLVVILLTTFSWFGIGFFYGWGYCFLTDWHWQIRHQLGHHDLPNSFIKWIIDEIFNIDSNQTLVDLLVVTCFIISLSGSVYTNIRDHKVRRNY